MKGITFSVESWSPEYGTPVNEAIFGGAKAQVEEEVEREVKDWLPITPSSATRRVKEVIFIDGVRRMEGIIWRNEPGKKDRQAFCSSYAAGALLAGDSARLLEAQVKRSLFCPFAMESPLCHGNLCFVPFEVQQEGQAALMEAADQALHQLEMEITIQVDGHSELLILDGPLKDQAEGKSARIGFIKTHQVPYLSDALIPVVAALKAGERTPLFQITTNWSRYSWYLRLPVTAAYSWAGIVRLEASTHLTQSDVISLADQTSVLLPPYASQAHKDPRAPQNLVPIGGLEKELRHLLGDPAFIYRALRRAAG